MMDEGLGLGLGWWTGSGFRGDGGARPGLGTVRTALRLGAELGLQAWGMGAIHLVGMGHFFFGGSGGVR